MVCPWTKAAGSEALQRRESNSLTCPPLAMSALGSSCCLYAGCWGAYGRSCGVTGREAAGDGCALSGAARGSARLCCCGDTRRWWEPMATAEIGQC